MDVKPDEKIHDFIRDNDSHTEADEEVWPLAGEGMGKFNDREKRRVCGSELPWIVSTFALLSMTSILLARGWQFARCEDRNLSRIEFGPSESVVKTRVVKFTSGLIYNETGSLVRTRDPNQIDWVGTPSKELDEAWNQLIAPQDLFATEEEVKDANLGPEEYLVPEFGLYEVELEVFHSLYCLNLLRRAIYLPYYPEIQGETLMTHVDHCIDGLRQTFMCNSDLTPIPVVWSPPGKRLMPDFENTHLCRDFYALKKWTKTRKANEPEIAKKMNGAQT